MKCKEREQVIITSSAENSIAEIPATDKRMSDSMFLQLFIILHLKIVKISRRQLRLCRDVKRFRVELFTIVRRLPGGM